MEKKRKWWHITPRSELRERIAYLDGRVKSLAGENARLVLEERKLRQELEQRIRQIVFLKKQIPQRGANGRFIATDDNPQTTKELFNH